MSNGKNRKKRILNIAAAAGALGIASALLVAAMSAPLQAETVTLEPQDAEITVTEQGSCQYRTTMDIYPALSGKLQEIKVKEGDRVKEGDALALLSADNVEYQIQRLQSEIRGHYAQINNLSLSEQKERDGMKGTKEELQGQLTSLDAQVESHNALEATRESQISLQRQIVEQERNNVRLARQNLRDYRDDYGSDTSDPEYVQMKQALIEAEKGLSASEQRLLELETPGTGEGYYDGQRESLQAQIDSLDSQMGKHYNGGMQSYYYAQIQNAQVSIEELRAQQGDAAITATCDGVITSLPIKDSNLVSLGSVIATIGCDPVVEAFVPVRDIDGIAVGDSVRLTVAKRAGDAVCEGKVASVDQQAQIRLSPLGVEESRVRVVIRTDDPAVKVGYQVDAAFVVHRQENCLILPKKAFFTGETGEDCVWVVRDGVAAIQPVVKGMETRGGYLVEEGVSAGDVIVADANIQGLEEGRKIAQ